MFAIILYLVLGAILGGAFVAWFAWDRILKNALSQLDKAEAAAYQNIAGVLLAKCGHGHIRADCQLCTWRLVDLLNEGGLPDENYDPENC